MKPTWARFPGIFGTIAFVLYVAWNAYWLLQGAVPPSIALAVFGVPAPTTGMTRSTFAMLRGDFSASFFWNPLTLPVLVLLIYTPLEIGVKYFRGRRVVFSRPLGLLWAAVLLLAWLAKFLIGPDSW